MGSIANMPSNQTVCTETSNNKGATLPRWKAQARQKRAAQLALFPQEWRIALPDTLPTNTHAFLSSHPLLTPSEHRITSILSASKLISLIARRELTSLEVTTAFCKRAALAQQLINCCTEIMFVEALERAQWLDEYLEKQGKVVGPLHGLPVSLKDLFEVEGRDNTVGMLTFFFVQFDVVHVVSLLWSWGTQRTCSFLKSFLRIN